MLVSLSSRLCRPMAGRQVFQLRFKLIDLPGQFLGLAPEVHPPELVDLRLQSFDLVVAGGDLPHHVRERCLLLEHQSLELSDGGGKRRMLGHASQFTSLLRGLQHRQRGGSSRLPPVDALKQHRKLGARQMDLSAIGLGPDKTASLQSFCEQPESVISRPKQLHEIAATPAEDEQVAAQRILFECCLHLRGQPLEPAAHVRHAGR